MYAPAAAPTGAAVEIRKKEFKMKPKQILKRAIEDGDVDRATLANAVTRIAAKAYPDAATPEIAFAKHIAANPGLRQIIDGAPVAARAAPKTSFEALCRGAAEHVRKLGTSLPPGSPYAGFLAKSGDSDAGGERDAVDPNFEDQASKAVKAVAQGLVDNGKFSDVATAVRFMRSSPAYSGLFGAGPKYREAIAGMRRDHL
jgi:hypothetical protein